MRRLPLLFALALAFLASGCIHHHHGSHGPGHGPPPWAPAHGYRHKHHHDGVQLVFDSGLGVYVVVGQPYHWFHHDHYYWLHDGEWHRSKHLGGPWVVADFDGVPPGLRRHHARHGDHGGKPGRGGPGKGGHGKRGKHGD
jgi:hypothetical protein